MEAKLKECSEMVQKLSLKNVTITFLIRKNHLKTIQISSMKSLNRIDRNCNV